MATTRKCSVCGAQVGADQRKCPACGAPNENYVEHKLQLAYEPKTIGELKAYCAKRGMPLQRMRFFIDQDYREPKAFGIYQDGSSFIVYKNKSDGSRFVRYDGPDEEKAVYELFSKLLEECHKRGIIPENWTPS